MNSTSKSYPRWLIILILLFIFAGFVVLGVIINHKYHSNESLSKYILMPLLLMLEIGFFLL